MTTQYYNEGNNWDTGATRVAEAITNDLLIVFVHGIRSDFRATWTELKSPPPEREFIDVPKRILEEASFDADVLVFAHPSKTYQKTSVEDSARMLGDRIANAFPKRTHRNIVFLTHSLGGLVVKQLLCDQAKATFESLQLANLGTSDAGNLESKSIWYRTRLAINIDTPHLGGIRWLTLLYPVYAVVVRPLVWMSSWIPIYLRLKCWPWGTNRQIKQLWTRCSYLIDLEKKYQDWCREFSEWSLPSPVRFEFRASVKNTILRTHGARIEFDENLGEIATAPGFDQYEQEIPGDHTAAIINSIPSCARILRKYLSDYLPYFVAERTLALLLYTKEIRVDKLLEPQQKMVQELIDEVRAPAFGFAFRVAVLEADAGLGKSTVARALTRSCALSRLKYAHGAKVIHVPLHRLSTNERITSAEHLWEEIVRRYSIFANELAAPYPQLTTQFFNSQLLNAHMILVLDGLEEFLMNSAGVSREAALGITEYLRTHYGGNRRLFVLVTLRRSWFTEYERRLVALGTPTRSLVQATDDDLIRVFPHMKLVLEETKDAPLEARLLIRSPLIAGLLKSSTPFSRETVSRWNFRTEADVYEFVIFSRTSTLGIQTPIPEPTLREICRVLGWQMFCSWGQPIALCQLSRSTWKCAIKWYRYVRAHGHQVLSDSIAVVVETVIRSTDRATARKIRKSIREDLIPALLRRSVFTAYDAMRFRPMHREIEDYLAASYIARCIQFRKFRDLGERGGTVRSFQLAGQRIDRIVQLENGANEQIFSPQFVEDLWNSKVVENKRSRIVFGTVAVIAAHSNTQCSRDFFDAIIKKLRGMDEMARHISFGGLCYRMLRNNSWDHDLRELVKPELKKYVDGDELLNTSHSQQVYSVDVVTRSMAWCYLKAVNGVNLGDKQWADLGVADRVVADASRVFFGPPSDGFLDENLALAHQISFEQLLVSFEKDEHRPVSVAHFLLGLAVGYRQQMKLNSSLQTAIRRFFANKGETPYKKLVTYNMVPELRAVVDLAERLIDDTT